MAPRTQAQRAAAVLTPTTGIRCACGGRLSDVIDSRERQGWVWRRRGCESCGARETTEERPRHTVARETYTTGSAVDREDW